MNPSLHKLRNLVGMKKIAAQFEQYLIDMRMSREKGMPFRGHMALMGNPGTGKTTAARLFCEILHEEGLLSKGQFVYVTPYELIGQHVGETETKTKSVCESAIGGVLCIDEAYGLMAQDTNEYNRAQEAIGVLIEFMTSTEAHAIVMFAGYPDEIRRFIDSNDGLKSRINYEFIFEDYTNDELTELFHKMLIADKCTIDEDALNCAKDYFSSLPRGKGFGNAREAQNLWYEVKTNQAQRCATNPTNADIFTILPQDFPNYGRTNKAKEKNSVSSSWEKLNQLRGIDAIREQFNDYCNCIKALKESRFRIRPLIAFVGNPGTGKTTVARLFAEILFQEGMLYNNNFIEACPADILGEYVGQTSAKLQALLERAKGGALYIYIDEAYGLMSDPNTRMYGDKAINALLQFVEENDNTLIILSGYEKEMEDFFNNSNPFLKPKVNTYFYFKDFRPEDLYNIFTGKLDGYELSDSFKTKMQQIIQYQYEHRNREWGNARTMEMYANEIIRNHLVKHNGEGVIDVDCIPEHLWIDNVIFNSIPMKNLEAELNLQINEMQAKLQNSIRMRKLKAEMNLLVNEIQTKLQQLQSKLDELFEE